MLSFPQTSRFLVRQGLAVRRELRARSGTSIGSAPVVAWAGEITKPGIHIIAGDSIASRYPMSSLPKVPEGWINRGWPGDKIDDLTARIEESLKRCPGTLLLQVGSNDLLRGGSEDSIDRSYRLLLQVCLASVDAADILICPIPPAAIWRADPTLLRAANRRLQALAAEAGTRFADTWTALADAKGRPSPGMIRKDGVHLQADGYTAMAEVINRSLNEPPRWTVLQ